MGPEKNEMISYWYAWKLLLTHRVGVMGTITSGDGRRSCDCIPFSKAVLE
jgi:hypothetical protein